MLDNIFRGQLMGAKAGTFTADDIEAFKFNFNKKRTYKNTGLFRTIVALLLELFTHLFALVHSKR